MVAPKASPTMLFVVLEQTNTGGRAVAVFERAEEADRRCLALNKDLPGMKARAEACPAGNEYRSRLAILRYEVSAAPILFATPPRSATPRAAAPSETTGLCNACGNTWTSYGGAFLSCPGCGSTNVTLT